MHEYSIVQALMGQVERTVRQHANGRTPTVHRLHVAIGELSGVEIPLLRTASDTVRERTLCARAELEVHEVSAEWTCPACSRTIPRGTRLACPDCGQPARLTQGDEIVLQRIEMEVP